MSNVITAIKKHPVSTLVAVASVVTGVMLAKTIIATRKDLVAEIEDRVLLDQLNAVNNIINDQN